MTHSNDWSDSDEDEEGEDLPEGVTKIVCVHTKAGYHVEVDGKVRGTTFPDIHAAIVWMTILDSFYREVATRFEDRRGVRE